MKGLPHAELIARDNNDYLVAYRLDTGAEVAFDPRTERKGSLFVEKLPQRLLETDGVSLADTYPPKNPSTALQRVSSNLHGLAVKYRVEVHNKKGLERLIEWVRWV